MNSCNETSTLFSSPLFNCLLGAELLVGIFGALTNTFLLIGLCKTRLFHNNLRILLIHMCLASLCYSTSMSVKMIYVFIQSFVDVCQFVISLYDCKLSELFFVLPLLGMMYSLVPVGLERAYATVRYRRYEKSKCICLSLSLIAAVWTGALFIQMRPLASVSKIITTPFCVNVMVMTNTAAISMLIIGLIQECVALGLYLTTYFVNTTLYMSLLINRAAKSQSLSSRFQLSQNIQVSELMLPTAAVHAACLLPTNIFAVLVVSGLDIEFAHRVELVHAAYLSALVYAALNPMICFVRNAALRRAMLSLLKTSGTKTNANPALPKSAKTLFYTRGSGGARNGDNANIRSDQHFDILVRSWQKTESTK